MFQGKIEIRIWVRIYMKKIKSNHKKCKFTYIKITVSTLFLCLLAVKGLSPLKKTGANLFHIRINGQDVGAVREEALAEELLLQARRNIASAREGMVFLEAEMVVESEERLWGVADSREDVLRRMEEVLWAESWEVRNRSCTLKVKEKMFSLACAEDVRALLQAAIDKYDSEGRFSVELAYDSDRKFGVLTAQVVDVWLQEKEELRACMGAGVQDVFSDIAGWADDGQYKPGVREMGFSDEIEIVETYLPARDSAEFSQAAETMLLDLGTVDWHEVEREDVLSAVALKVSAPTSRIVELDESLEEESSALYMVDEMLMGGSEPVLSVERVEEEIYEESYEADVVYLENDSWYTNQKQVIQQPSAGFRRILARVYYENDQETAREILEEEIVQEAVAKVVEQGTKALPTYMKPVMGGVLSSGFGGRNAPARGASTNHKGVDWSVPTGTAVYASCAGIVSKAGWGSGYGYVVYIEHQDGRQTRYGHLSKVQVEVGQEVGQGEQIALSGSTGNVTGPHLHFEILIGGTQVNPLDYLE